MARKQGYSKDFSKLKTTGPAKSFTQEESDAAGAPAPAYDPALHAALGRQVEDRAKRWVAGRYEIKGRSPMHVLTPAQFSQFTNTGEWEGMPSVAEYGPHSAVPEDKEYEAP
jgi:hypothetical protein